MHTLRLWSMPCDHAPLPHPDSVPTATCVALHGPPPRIREVNAVDSSLRRCGRKVAHRTRRSAAVFLLVVRCRLRKRDEARRGLWSVVDAIAQDAAWRISVGAVHALGTVHIVFDDGRLGALLDYGFQDCVEALRLRCGLWQARVHQLPQTKEEAGGHVGDHALARAHAVTLCDAAAASLQMTASHRLKLNDTLQPDDF
eukprot:7006726-Prymnesium_polylepis.2